MRHANYNGRRWRKIKSKKYGFIWESYYPKPRTAKIKGNDNV
jgi:hypothetical protein